VRTSIEAYAAEPRAFLAALGLAIAAMLTAVASYGFASWVTGTSADWITVTAVAPVVVVLGVLPISPQGLGVAEASAEILFSLFGVESGATIVLVNRLWAVALCLPGCVLYLTSRATLSPEVPDS
jgi:uncharacterized membrane protein YbhN (UPF0104 family)